MTVKCLTEGQQRTLVDLFTHSGTPIEELVVYYDRSRRTIIRVLEDHGVDPKIHRRPGRSKPKAMPTEQAPLPLDPAVKFPPLALAAALVDQGSRPKPIFPRDMPEPIKATQPAPRPLPFPGFPVHPLLIQTPESHTYGRPWYRRLADSVRRFFRAYPTSLS